MDDDLRALLACNDAIEQVEHETRARLLDTLISWHGLWEEIADRREVPKGRRER